MLSSIFLSTRSPDYEDISPATQAKPDVNHKKGSFNDTPSKNVDVSTDAKNKAAEVDAVNFLEIKNKQSIEKRFSKDEITPVVDKKIESKKLFDILNSQYTPKQIKMRKVIENLAKPTPSEIKLFIFTEKSLSETFARNTTKPSIY